MFHCELIELMRFYLLNWAIDEISMRLEGLARLGKRLCPEDLLFIAIRL